MEQKYISKKMSHRRQLARQNLSFSDIESVEISDSESLDRVLRKKGREHIMATFEYPLPIQIADDCQAHIPTLEA
jgi:hypothetical protein